MPHASTLFAHFCVAPLPHDANLHPAAALLVHFSQHVAPAAQLTGWQLLPAQSNLQVLPVAQSAARSQ